MSCPCMSQIEVNKQRQHKVSGKEQNEPLFAPSSVNVVLSSCFICACILRIDEKKLEGKVGRMNKKSDRRTMSSKLYVTGSKTVWVNRR